MSQEKRSEHCAISDLSKQTVHEPHHEKSCLLSLRQPCKSFEMLDFSSIGIVLSKQ